MVTIDGHVKQPVYNCINIHLVLLTYSKMYNIQKKLMFVLNYPKPEQDNIV